MANIQEIDIDKYLLIPIPDSVSKTEALSVVAIRERYEDNHRITYQKDEEGEFILDESDEKIIESEESVEGFAKRRLGEINLNYFNKSLQIVSEMSTPHSKVSGEGLKVL